MTPQMKQGGPMGQPVNMQPPNQNMRQPPDINMRQPTDMNIKMRQAPDMNMGEEGNFGMPGGEEPGLQGSNMGMNNIGDMNPGGPGMGMNPGGPDMGMNNMGDMHPGSGGPNMDDLGPMGGDPGSGRPMSINSGNGMPGGPLQGANRGGRGRRR